MEINPFSELAIQLSAIHQTNLEILALLKKQPPSLHVEETPVELEEAARRVFLSKDRFYAIHPIYFPKRGAGRKRLFLPSELEAYNKGELQPLIKHTNEVEQYRIRRLNKTQPNAA